MRFIIVGNMLKCDKRVFVSCYHSWSSQNRQLMLFVICHGCKYAGVWRVSGRCLDGVWKVSGGILFAIPTLSGECLGGVREVFGRCLKSVWRI